MAMREKKFFVTNETCNSGRLWFLAQVEDDRTLDDDTPQEKFLDSVPDK